MDSQDNKEAQSPEVLQIKKPKRVLHCSDGIYEEYSSDEDQKPKDENQALPFKVARSVLNALDYAGETLAEFLNITTPKYSYEIEQIRKEQERISKEEAIERDNTWDVEINETFEPITKVPSKTVEKF